MSGSTKFEAPQKFPEPDQDEEDDLEIEVLDDTPEEDHREARPAAIRPDVDSDDFENEIKDYSENAQKRIKAVKFEFHEERRAKEAALRQSEEAVRYAQRVAADNEALRRGWESTNSILDEQHGATVTAKLEKARADYKDAYEEGDTDKLLEAQELISQLHFEIGSRKQRAQAQQYQQSQQVRQPQQQQNVAANLPPQDAKAASWLRNNPWFHSKGNEDMTGYAVGLHQKLVQGGLNPQTDDEYYVKIDRAMRSVFPDRFSDGDLGGVEVDTSAANSPRKKPPVGGPTRGGKPPRKVQLTTTQVALAKRLGLSNKQYAAQVAKEQLKNG